MYSVSLSFLQNDLCTNGEMQTKKMRKKVLGLSYLVDESPPWYIAIMLGFQVCYLSFSFWKLYIANLRTSYR